MLLALLALLLWPAAALGVDGDGEVTFAIPLEGQHGLSVKLEADDDEIQLTVSKRRQQTTYFTDGAVSRDGISAKFAGFGEFVVDYEPLRTLETHGPNRHCEGEPKTTTEGYLRGTLRFRGEGGYVEVEASRAKGTLVLQPLWECDYRRPAASASRAGGDDEGGDSATLTASSRRTKVGFAAIGARETGERPYTYFFASSSEVTEGIGISRYTYAVTRSAGFEFDHRRGTASIDPPAPFGGSAHFRRRPGHPARWTGSLTAPLLGLGRVRLAGPGFIAKMVPDLPEVN